LALIQNNAVVVLFGCISAIIGWKCPAIALAYPAFMLINTIFFHVLPVLKSRRFFSGLLTALLLFIPVASLVYYGAGIDRVISIKSITFSIIIGIFFMAYPIILQKLKTKPFFQQPIG
jgi:hypothetical protein